MISQRLKKIEKALNITEPKLVWQDFDGTYHYDKTIYQTLKQLQVATGIKDEELILITTQGAKEGAIA